jgi:RNA polymerase sigma-70 factor (ECF subfamily)
VRPILGVVDDDRQRLVERARAGDALAFAGLLRERDRGLRALAFRLLGSADEMDDVLQDAYVKAFVALPRFRGDAALGTWLYRVVYNTCLDHLRRRPPEAAEAGADLAGSTRDPADLVAERSALEAGLAALTPVERGAVLLVDAEGFSYADAAEILGVAPGTIASRLNRARASLRRSLRTLSEGVAQ